MAPGFIGLDFETYSGVDLPTHGLHRYVNSNTFKVLLGSVSEVGVRTERFDFALNGGKEIKGLRSLIGNKQIVAHNAGFERKVLDAIGLHYPPSKFIDSAVIARAAGASGKLEAAAPQLLGGVKLETGGNLIKLFCIPGPYQEKNGDLFFDNQIIHDHRFQWDQFGEYCDVDSELGLALAVDYLHELSPKELQFAEVTLKMNNIGWPIDIPMVEEMQRRYLENQEQALFEFRQKHSADELNLNSLKQMKEWCADRGIKATSFDEKHVAKLLVAIEKKLAQPGLTSTQIENYIGVTDLLRTKQILGGASLKKLQVMLDTAVETDEGWRLKDQYLHCGAGQTLRTTGRSVQMQNLKRLDAANLGNMDELLEDEEIEWDNTKLASNMRQCFTSSHPEGQLIVGDFSSVESRGLAWQAGEKWKTDAYRSGLDVYKMQASHIYGVPYDRIIKEQRQTGKVGELSCGYGAGGGAVQSFASGMGVSMTEAEATKLVSDWRNANPKTVQYWEHLDSRLHEVVNTGQAQTFLLPDGLVLAMRVQSAPSSLRDQTNRLNLKTLVVEIRNGGEVYMRRFFHGVYARGRNVCYFKPSERKTGDLWRPNYKDPKTGQLRFYELYGGKLAGIVTQSLCREIFMRCMKKVSAWTSYHGNVNLIGQFHDELVLDWWPAPAGIGLSEAVEALENLMSDAGDLKSFPLEAEIKFDYRYTK